MAVGIETISKLKNFANINANLVYTGDGKLKTISEAKNILAIANIAEDWKEEFGIYDLNEFIAVANIIQNPDFSYNREGCTFSGNGRKIKYTFADPAILTAPTKEVTMPAPEVVFDITNDELNELRKAAATLGHNTLRVTPESLSVVDSSGATANEFSMTYKLDSTTKDEWFQMDFLINNLKLMQGDYKVNLSSKLISEWVGEDITYWIALEKTSKYGK